MPPQYIKFVILIVCGACCGQLSTRPIIFHIPFLPPLSYSQTAVAAPKTTQSHNTSIVMRTLKTPSYHCNFISIFTSCSLYSNAKTKVAETEYKLLVCNMLQLRISWLQTTFHIQLVCSSCHCYISMTFTSGRVRTSAIILSKFQNWIWIGILLLWFVVATSARPVIKQGCGIIALYSNYLIDKLRKSHQHKVT